MKIGDRVYVSGYVDEIRQDTVIIRNSGGYFGTVPSEVSSENLFFNYSDKLWNIAYERGKAEAQPQKGKWIDVDNGQECSECHEIQFGYDSKRFFCQHCGADMRGEQDEH